MAGRWTAGDPSFLTLSRFNEARLAQTPGDRRAHISGKEGTRGNGSDRMELMNREVSATGEYLTAIWVAGHAMSINLAQEIRL